MKKIFILIFITLVVFPLLADGEVTESSEQEDATFTLLWNPDDTAYLVFGLTTQKPGGYAWEPSSDSEADFIYVNNPVRSDSSFFATNITSLYAFCNAYANVRFNINVSSEPFSNGDGTPIHFTTSWDGGGYVESGAEPEVMFTYIPTDGAYSQYRTLTILTQLPNDAVAMGHTGKVKLSLEVL